MRYQILNLDKIPKVKKGVPFKITYQAGECDRCKGEKRIISTSNKPGWYVHCPKCNGTGKLHPKVGDTFKYCYECNWFWEECKGVCKCDEPEWTNHKFLSINKEKEKAEVVII